jgi:hypothetical protein
MKGGKIPVKIVVPGELLVTRYALRVTGSTFVSSLKANTFNSQAIL